MQSISNTGSVTYECGINQENWNTKKLELEALFGYDVDRIGQVVFGEKYYTEINPNGISGGGGEEININNFTYECNGLVGSANPDQRGSDNGFQDFDLCTNTIVLNSLLNIPTSSNLTDNPGEREVYAFVLEQGKNYTLESFGDDTDSDTVFFLFDNQGNKLAMNDDIDNSIYRSSIDFTPNYTGYYFLGVMGCGDEGTYADYTLDISEGGGPKLVNGLCGSDAGKSLVVAPVNLCNKGTSSIVVDEGEGLNFTWTCDGLNGGTNTSCSATHKIPPVCNYQQADIDALNVAGANGNFEIRDEYYTQLTAFPLTKPQWCSVVNLTWLGGATVTPEIYTLDLLKGLVLNNNGITSLPAEIGNLTNLEYLEGYNNQLTSLPSQIGNLTYLTNLNFSRNLIASLPSQIGNLTLLTGLSLSTNQLTTLPPEIGNLTNLMNISLGYNQLSSLPLEIGNLVNLTTIDFEGNKITGIPSTFGNLAKLSYLRIRNNKISALPVEFFNLTSLTSLYIETNLLSILPPEIGNLTSLRSLYLDANPLTSIPPEIGNLTNLGTLYLWKNQLTTLPAEFANMTSLGTLHYGANSGTTVPEAIFNLPNLKSLGLLDISQVTSISPSIANLSNLESLTFRWASHLPTVPPEIGNLPKLERLYFGNSAITSLPTEIGNISTLETFILYNTQLTTLPEGMKNFSNLTSLNISGTPGIGQLNYNFTINTPNRSQGNIPTAGKTMTIGGNGTKIVISVSP